MENENTSATFTYSFFYRFLYRYGNIPGTIVLSAFLITVATNLNYSLLYLLPFIITALLIYFVNKQYLTMYKIMAYKISADDEKLTGINFLSPKKKVVIYYSDIEKIEGGIFDGKLNGLTKIWDSKSKMCLGFFNKIENSKLLVKIILLHVSEPVYKQAMARARIDLKEIKPAQKDN